MENTHVELTGNHILVRNPDVVERKIHKSYFLIDITDNYSSNKCALYEINDVSSFIWNRIDGQRMLGDIAVELKRAITEDIDLQILLDDICEFAELLLMKRFVEV